MSRIQKIKIQNFKAISEFEADFKGCTAIVTAGNNKGKTSLLRGIPDSIRFVRPDVMVKEGATKGKGEMTLDTGEKFLWDFDTKGQHVLTYVSSDNVKQKVTVANENNLQLLIERPDFEGGEIKYEIIENESLTLETAAA